MLNTPWFLLCFNAAASSFICVCWVVVHLCWCFVFKVLEQTGFYQYNFPNIETIPNDPAFAWTTVLEGEGFPGWHPQQLQPSAGQPPPEECSLRPQRGQPAVRGEVLPVCGGLRGSVKPWSLFKRSATRNWSCVVGFRDSSEAPGSTTEQSWSLWTSERQRRRRASASTAGWRNKHRVG